MYRVVARFKKIDFYSDQLNSLDEASQLVADFGRYETSGGPQVYCIEYFHTDTNQWSMF